MTTEQQYVTAAYGGLLTDLSKHYPSELNLTVTEGGGLAL